MPVRAGETTDSDDAAPRAVRFNKVAEVIICLYCTYFYNFNSELAMNQVEIIIML